MAAQYSVAKRILIVEDDVAFSYVVAHRLERVGLQTKHVDSVPGALALIGSGAEFDLCLIDVRLSWKGPNGIALAGMLSTVRPAMPCICMSISDFDGEAAPRGIQVLNKGSGLDLIVQTVQASLQAS